MVESPGPTVSARGLVAGYGRAGRTPDVLRGLDLTIRPGTITAVVGPNGAGKSTLFRTLLGLLRPRAGRVTIGGRPPPRHRALLGFGYLPEAVVLPRGWTAREWVESAARLKGVPKARAPDEAGRQLEAMGVNAYRNTRLEHLSRGNARRVALGWVLAASPAVLFLDEPLAALDAPARRRVRRTLHRLRGPDTTVVVATHELREVPHLADRGLVLAGGRVVATLDRPDPDEMEAHIMAASGGREGDEDHGDPGDRR